MMVVMVVMVGMVGMVAMVEVEDVVVTGPMLPRSVFKFKVRDQIFFFFWLLLGWCRVSFPCLSSRHRTVESHQCFFLSPPPHHFRSTPFNAVRV